jgi:hypothetical protein
VPARNERRPKWLQYVLTSPESDAAAGNPLRGRTIDEAY